MTDWSDLADRLAARHVAAGAPTAWFDELYRAGRDGEVSMPWDRTTAHRLLAEWLAERPAPDPARARAVVVGSGLGADVELLAAVGWDALGFDVSPTAVALAAERSRHASARYALGDLFALPAEWLGAFDLVVEVFTVQALPRSVRPAATEAVRSLVAPGGTLLVVSARAERPVPDADGPPWPLTREEVEAFAGGPVRPVRIESASVGDGPGDVRWRAEFRA